MILPKHGLYSPVLQSIHCFSASAWFFSSSQTYIYYLKTVAHLLIVVCHFETSTEVFYFLRGVIKSVNLSRVKFSWFRVSFIFWRINGTMVILQQAPLLNAVCYQLGLPSFPRTKLRGVSTVATVLHFCLTLLSSVQQQLMLLRSHFKLMGVNPLKECKR